MDDQPDPALQFFPDGDIDLYKTLGLAQEATEEEIKKAYRKLALRFHPDKVLSHSSASASGPSHSSSTSDPAEEASRKFQQIGFAYAVLSNPTRRSRYDKSGRTEEGLFAGRGEDGEPFEWNEYFKELWTGQVNGKTLEEFKKKYQGTDEEKEDLYAAYTDSSGSLEAIFTLVPCSELLHDEERFIDLVESAIQAGTVERLPQWDADIKDKSKRAALRKKAKTEAKEAEEYAKELGVWDDLFGDGSKSTKNGAKGKAKDGAGKEKAKAGKKGTGKEEEEEEDISGLAALIRNRQASRQNGLDNLISRFEADAASGTSKGKGKSKQKKGEAPSAAPPTDEEFEALQKKMFAGEKRKKEEAGSASAAGTKKKQKKG